ncbi:MAG: hypothetical protein PVG71_11395, partial [Anaerolineae bacterium]
RSPCFLSGRYAAGTTEMRRSMLAAAGEALLAFNQGIGICLTLLLVTHSDLIVSLVMLGSGAFSRRTAGVGLVPMGSSLACSSPWPWRPGWLPYRHQSPLRFGRYGTF